MDRWRKILDRWRPRSDADREFYPEFEEIDQPVLLNAMGPMTAALVGARLLRAVVARRGSILKPSAVEKLERLVARGLPDEVVHHCENEAEQILEWIDRGPVADGEHPLKPTGLPDFDTMVSADIDSRLSVAQFALDEGYDLELEYFDEDSGIWPRIEAQILAIEGAEAKDFQTALRLRTTDGVFEIPVKFVRWLMPIAAQQWDDDEGGDVLEFPGGEDRDQ